MKFTYSWLKEYVDIKLKPQELADKLTMAGLEIEYLERLDGDWVFEAEVTANRPDWLSIIGIAREVAAVTGKKLKISAMSYGLWAMGKKAQSPKLAAHSPSIQVLDIHACPRYTGRIISNVKVAPSPEWLVKRLKSIGLRPVNNIVDITNFVLFETGQPLHAFDFDKLSGGKIIVRRAKDNEEIISIDGAKRKLNPNTLVIADEKAAIAVAGVMGGMATEVNGTTKIILLESAYFNPAMIRKASRFLALSSDSSYRFERGVDLAGVKAASDRATELIIKIAGGAAGKLADVGKKAASQPKISINPQKVNDLLGVKIPEKDIVKILTSLGLKKASKTTFLIPSWRGDLKKEIDLIEEVVRIYGYDKIPAAAPRDIDDKDRVVAPKQFEFQALLRNTLAGFGLNEVITYSLVDKNIDQMFQSEAQVKNIVIENPLSPGLAVLRTNLIAGMLLSAKWNINRNINDIKLFEIGPVYFADKLDKPEENYLAICLSGARVDNWQDGVKPVDFYYLKGIVEALFAGLGIRGCDIALSENNIFTQGQSAVINISGDAVGFLGKVKKELLNKIDIDPHTGAGKDCFACQIDLEKLYGYARSEKRFLPIPKFPAVCRDISTLARQEVSSGQILDVIKEAAAGLVKEIKLFDIYRGEQIPKGRKSFVYRLTYQSSDKTLTDSEVACVHSRIISSLKEKLAVDTR